MSSLLYRGGCSCLSWAGRRARVVAACRWKGGRAAEPLNKPLKQWTLIVSPQSRLCVELPCSVRVSSQDPFAYPHADRVFVTVSGVDRNVHRGLDLDNIEVKYEESSRQVVIHSRDIDSHTCVEVTTPVRFDVNIKTSGTGSVNIKKIECDNCHIETEKGDSVLQSVKSHAVNIRTDGGKVSCLGTVYGNVNIYAAAQSSVKIEKLQGTSINICTEDGTLKAKYLYTESSSISSASGDIRLGSVHGDVNLHSQHGSVTVGSLDGSLSASTCDGAMDIYVSQVGQVHLKSEEGCITVRVPEKLPTSLQLAGTTVDVSPDIQLNEIQTTSKEGQVTLTASINAANGRERWIKAESKRGTVSLKTQNWLQSLKFHTT
ncbi:hypothetical protein XENTR_v10008786 [Xenopus tropicalis]|uniref:Family with sequence similarity 185 member A n=1 Tax=Xenopus tropicalis TaxID=8364 RepID=F6PY23_XENTR|nr:hypothetical protein XENTR_v10008786 [Xenopus tropicalis]